MKIQRRNELPASWQRLVELCRKVNFGYIEDVVFQNGFPSGHGAVIKTVMPGPNKNNGPGVSVGSTLRPQWADIFAVATSAPLVRVRRFEIVHGNPFRLHVEDSGGTLDG